MRESDVKAAMGKIIYELRTRKGMTQQKLADRMGVTRPAITKMEKGRIDIPAVRIQQLADIFGVSPGRFFPKLEPVTLEALSAS